MLRFLRDAASRGNRSGPTSLHMEIQPLLDLHDSQPGLARYTDQPHSA